MDVGSNAAITFKLVGDESRNFSIQGSSGVIKTSSSAAIDFELNRVYVFRVSATDVYGTGNTVYSNVTITVLDLNDNKPKFPNIKYYIEVPESVSNGHFILKVNASDPDSGYFGSIHYRIISGSEGKFSIDATNGIIRVESPLDREKRELYKLNVSAYDGGIPPNVGYSTVFVNVTDVNDNFPVFINTQSEVIVSENVAVGTPVTRIQTSDADLNADKYIHYSMESNAFEINSYTGVIRTSVPLDRESVNKYIVRITAADNGGHQSNISLMVRIDDINDNRPSFLTVDPMTIDLFEKTPNGSIIAVAEAIDQDAGMNGKIEYFVSERSGYLLAIDNKTGILRYVVKILQHLYNH